MKFGMTLLGAGLLVLPLSPQPPTEDPLLRWMDKIAQGQLDARDKEIAAVRTVADAERQGGRPPEDHVRFGRIAGLRLCYREGHL
jgi:hypothetical protein